MAIAPWVYTKLPYNPTRDFAPVSLLGSPDIIVVVNPRCRSATPSSCSTMRRRIPASSPSLRRQRLDLAPAGRVLQVDGQGRPAARPYKGDAQMVTDLLGGQVNMAFGTAVAWLPHIKSGKVAAVAVTNPKRSDTLTDLPTLNESGVPGYEAVQWFGIAAPTGTPPRSSQRMYAEIKAILAMPRSDALRTELGFDVVGNYARGVRAVPARREREVEEDRGDRRDEAGLDGPARVAVIGAGVVGLACAAHLQMRGHASR
jgi:tripartite-type tricarboxylate transporter receptor subunit TctC